MPLVIKGKTYYRTHEALALAGISRATWYRWKAARLVKDAKQKDRRGWRLFTLEEVERLREFAQQVKTVPSQSELDLG